MFPAMYTHYYWEEKREEIYRSAPTRTRVVSRRRGGVRRVRDRRAPEREVSLECLSHGEKWAGHYNQLMEGLSGRVLPSWDGFKEELTSTVCSCDERDREKCRDAAARFGFTAGSNLPALELNDRMRFTELYFHNILNSPQFTTEYIESTGLEDPAIHIIQGLHAARTVIYALVQRCVLNNDLKAYRLLDIIRLYIQKPNCGCIHLSLPTEEEEALNKLFMLEKGDHMNLVAKLFGCQIVLGLSNESSPPTLALHLSTANLNDIKGVQEYFQEPIGYKAPPPKSTVEDEVTKSVDAEASAEAVTDNVVQSSNEPPDEPKTDSEPESGASQENVEPQQDIEQGNEDLRETHGQGSSEQSVNSGEQTLQPTESPEGNGVNQGSDEAAAPAEGEHTNGATVATQSTAEQPTTLDQALSLTPPQGTSSDSRGSDQTVSTEKNETELSWVSTIEVPLNGLSTDDTTGSNRLPLEDAVSLSQSASVTMPATSSEPSNSEIITETAGNVVSSQNQDNTMQNNSDDHSTASSSQR